MPLDAAVTGEELWLAAPVEGAELLVFDTCQADAKPAAGGGPVAVLDSDQNVATVVWPDGGLHSLHTLCAEMSCLGQ